MKEIEIEGREEGYGIQGKGCAVLRESGLVERPALVGSDRGIEGADHWRWKEQKLETMGDIALVP